MTLRAFVLGLPRWRSQPVLPVTSALLAVIGIFLGGKLSALLVTNALYGDTAGPLLDAHSGIRPSDAALTALMIWLLSAQFAMVGLAIAVASMTYAEGPMSLLRLQAPADGKPAYIWSALAFAAVVAVVNLGLHLLRPDNIFDDLQLYIRLVRSDAVGIAAAAIIIGAPLSEELLFRGLLLPALAATRLGFAGAAVVSTALWTALHWGYSFAGMIEVAIFGLTLSWLLWRTGSLRVPLFCHALYNGLLFAALWLFAPGA